MGWMGNSIKQNPLSVRAQQNRKGSVGVIMSPNNNLLVQNKLVFSGSQLTTAMGTINDPQITTKETHR